MAKMRVHELAKELEIKSQEIIESLSGTEYEIKSASSNIDDAAQEIIRKKYKKSAPKAEEKSAAEKAEKPAAPKAEEKARPEEKKPADAEHDRPKKKSSITAVFNAQYSKQGAGHGNNRRPNQGAKGGRSQDGRRPSNDRGDRPAGQAKPAMSGNDMRKYFDSLINPNAGKETENKAPKAEEVKTETAQTAPAAQERVFKKPTEQETDRMADTITAQTATDQPVRRETVHTEIIMAKVDIITVTMVTDQPVREITEARDQTAETRDRSTTEDRDRDSIRETAAEDAIITSAEEIMVED